MFFINSRLGNILGTTKHKSFKERPLEKYTTLKGLFGLKSHFARRLSINTPGSLEKNGALSPEFTPRQKSRQTPNTLLCAKKQNVPRPRIFSRTPKKKMFCAQKDFAVRRIIFSWAPEKILLHNAVYFSESPGIFF